MILFVLAFITFSISNDKVVICFYDDNITECPYSSYKFSVSNFSEYIYADIPTSDHITFEFHAPTSQEDVINISRFDKSKLNKLEFYFYSNETQFPEFTLSTSDNFAPASLSFKNVKPTIDFNTNFSEFLLDNSPVTIPGRYIQASNLFVDSNSLQNVDLITSDSISFKNAFGFQKQQNFVIKSLTSNSKLDFIDVNSALLKISIVLSNLFFESQDNVTLLSFDLSNWYGNVTVNHGSFLKLFTVLECFAYSSNHHFPFLIVNFVGQLELKKSNWPKSDVPLLQITAMNQISFISNKIIISGFIPAHILTGEGDLTITPTIYSSGFMKLTVQNTNLSISQPLLFTENYYFFVNEIETTRKSGNTTIVADPPLMYVSIGKFTPSTSKSEFELRGTANYILKNLPSPTDGFTPTVYVEHLWFENNVTFNFDLENGCANIRVLDFVLMQTWPTYFIPLYNGNEKAVSEQKKFKLICAKLLKEQKESLMLPPSGFPRGFNRGASIVHSYYEQDPSTSQTLKCFGLDIYGEVTDVSNIFCLADESTKSSCPSDSQYIGENDNWKKFVNIDAGELEFYAFRGASLSFESFSMVNVSVIGSKGSEKIEIQPEGVDHLKLTNVDATLLVENSSVNVELTNSKLKGPSNTYGMGSLITDPTSLKSIEGRNDLEVQVIVKDVPDTKITIQKDGSVLLSDSGVSFKSRRSNHIEKVDEDNIPEPSSIILINRDVANIEFTFEQGSGQSIENSTIIAKFDNSSSTVSFNGLSYASRFFVLDGFSGTLNFGQETSIPIDLINDHDVTIQTSSEVKKLTFESELDLDGSFLSNVEIHSNRVRVVPRAITSEDSIISADHFAVLEDASATLKTLAITNSLSVFPGSHLSIENADEIPSEITVNYKLENLPSIFIGSESKKHKITRIVFSYEDDNFNTAIMNRTLLFKDGLAIVEGSGLDCSDATYDFESSYIYYSGSYSLLKAECVGDDHNTVKLFVNPYANEPPTASPAPLIPTQTPAPNNTREQVIIISMTVVTFFLIVVIVIIKCMNRKKKYVSKNKNLDTQPMLIPNEGNAE